MESSRKVHGLGPVVFWWFSLLFALPALGTEPVRFDYLSLLQTHPLHVPWQFQPGDDPAWADPAFDDSTWEQATIPARWREGGFPETGQMAWYRLTLQVKPDRGDDLELEPVLGLRIGKVISAYEVYAGGKLLGRVGRLPPRSEIVYDRVRIYPIPAGAIDPDGRMVVALRVWGGPQALLDAWYAGAHSGAVEFGSYSQLIREIMLDQMPTLVAVVLFLGFGFYHLYLYHRNRQLRLFLWFGLMAINIGIYCMALTQWKYMLGWSFMAYQKLEFGSVHLLPAVGIQMLWAVLEQRISVPLRCYQLSFVAISLLVVLSPGLAIHYSTLSPWHIWTLPLLLYAPWLLLREARAGNREARTMLPGIGLFALACICDIYVYYAGSQDWRFIPFGFAAIAVSMGVSLANSFTVMLGTLEEEVSKRTADLSEANLQLAEAARADPLTGLLNRRGFLEEASTEVQRFYRSGRSFSIVLGDIDHFKRFNDSHGHACGDYVLKRVGGILGDRLRDVDRVARWGGEEFILLLPETDTQGAAVLADKLRKVIADSKFHFEGETIGTTMTFGVATFRKDETLDNCIARADTAMYHGKKAGRNKVMLGGFKGLTLVN